MTPKPYVLTVVFAPFAPPTAVGEVCRLVAGADPVYLAVEGERLVLSHAFSKLRRAVTASVAVAGLGDYVESSSLLNAPEGATA